MFFVLQGGSLTSVGDTDSKKQAWIPGTLNPKTEKASSLGTSEPWNPELAEPWNPGNSSGPIEPDFMYRLMGRSRQQLNFMRI